MYILSIDSSNNVSFEVEYDFRSKDTILKSEHITRAGRKFTYKWGDLRRREFSVRFLSSGTASVINSWWVSNADLILQESGSTEVFSCRLANDNTPISKFEKPYNDKFKGIIELESY
jgi:hypothetical protein